MAAKTSGVCERLRSALSSLCCESAIVTLSLVSGLAITGEILINYGVLTTPNSSKTSTQEGLGSNITSDPSGGSSASSSSSDDKHVETMEIVEKVFHYISLVIAGVFFIEIILKLVVFRMVFLSKHWQVLDMLIVFATVMVEIAYEIEDRIPELEATTYIVVFRLWRLPYACNLKAESVRRALEQDIEVWKAGKRKLEEKYEDLEAKHNKQKEKIDKLERELSALKKDAKEGRQAKQSAAAPVPVASRNGAVPRDTTDGGAKVNRRKSSRHRARSKETSRGTQEQEHITIHSNDGEQGGEENTQIPGESEQIQDEEDRGTEDDTIHDDDGEDLGQGQRAYFRSGSEEDVGQGHGVCFRSGSESSLSCQALEHEVHVQIEETVQETSSRGTETQSCGNDDANEATGSTTVLLRKKDRTNNSKKFPSSGSSQPVCYDNSGYNPDGEEGEIEGELVYEIDGAKTYRSAEGIPMTSL